MKSNQSSIDDLLQEIRQKLSWGEVDNWNNYDFDQLSEKIEDKTDVQLSPVTLKRVFGKVKYNSKPSAHTLNTLSQFIDFKDFRDFQNGQRPILISTVEKSSDSKTSKKSRVLKFVMPTLIALGLAVILWSWISVDSVSSYKSSDFDFEFLKIGEDFPSSIIFQFDAKIVTPPSKIEIQQNWDEGRRSIVSSKDSIHNSIYFYPGFFEAKLSSR